MDLTTPAFVQTVVTDLTAAQITALPGMVSTASTLIQNWCNRQIGYQAGIDELVDAEESGQILIRETPVVNIERVASNPTGALYVTNFSGTTQRARIQIPSIDPTGLIGSSIVLETKSLGVTQSQTIVFATAGLGTIADLAGYISVQPGSWMATAEGDFSGWGLDDLVAGQGWQGARQQHTQFNVYGTEPDYSVDRRSGILTLSQSDWNDPFRSARFGPGFLADVIDGRIGEQY